MLNAETRWRNRRTLPCQKQIPSRVGTGYYKHQPLFAEAVLGRQDKWSLEQRSKYLRRLPASCPLTKAKDRDLPDQNMQQLHALVAYYSLLRPRFPSTRLLSPKSTS